MKKRSMTYDIIIRFHIAIYTNCDVSYTRTLSIVVVSVHYGTFLTIQMKNTMHII